MKEEKGSALILCELSKLYENGFQALSGINLEVESGDFFALLGPNGAGKSTIIGIICSLIRKTSGIVGIFGYDTDVNFSSAKKLIGIVPQEFNFNQFEKPIDILVTQAGYYGITRSVALKRAKKYLSLLGLWEKRGVSSRMLSGGMKRRLMIARALIHNPRLLILDEPTAGVDIELRRSMWGFLQDINEAGTTIILTTHYLEEAENLCRNVAIIDHGRIVQNTSVKSLVRQLQVQTFTVDLKDKLSFVPSVRGYPIRKVDDHVIEVDVLSHQTINSLIVGLSDQSIEVVSMSTKTNRLEELFLKIIEKNMENKI
ncbi:MAG: ABC transporter [Cellvibrionales bacterium TMED49]|nr:ABC transporter [Porticoccaceae bacterium]OUU37692.1 MAG: ABC transporter [Cellvibrionales bacterium TMED49]|tara:strand:+ start:330 stop:1271 length:942 start_codon:yes stop_codon:yes gene_type:complete